MCVCVCDYPTRYHRVKHTHEAMTSANTMFSRVFLNWMEPMTRLIAGNIVAIDVRAEEEEVMRRRWSTKLSFVSMACLRRGEGGTFIHTDRRSA